MLEALQLPRGNEDTDIPMPADALAEIRKTGRESPQGGPRMAAGAELIARAVERISGAGPSPLKEIGRLRGGAMSKVRVDARLGTERLFGISKMTARVTIARGGPPLEASDTARSVTMETLIESLVPWW